MEDREKKSTKWKTYQVGWNIMFGGINLWQGLFGICARQEPLYKWTEPSLKYYFWNYKVGVISCQVYSLEVVFVADLRVLGVKIYHF